MKQAAGRAPILSTPPLTIRLAARLGSAAPRTRVTMSAAKKSILSLGAHQAAIDEVRDGLQAEGYDAVGYVIERLEEAKAEMTRRHYDLIIAGGALPALYPTELADARAFAAEKCPTSTFFVITAAEIEAVGMKLGEAPPTPQEIKGYVVAIVNKMFAGKK